MHLGIDTNYAYTSVVWVFKNMKKTSTSNILARMTYVSVSVYSQ
jgi:hypothetical protein